MGKSGKTINYITKSGIIAGLYAVLTLLSASFGLASGPVQLRLSEALCVLPVLFPEAIPGLFVGCILGNLLSGAAPFDILFGGLATLAGAVLTYLLRKHRFLCLLPPIVMNTLVIPPVLVFVYNAQEAYPLLCLFIFAGEFLSAGVLGYFLLRLLRKNRLLFHAE